MGISHPCACAATSASGKAKCIKSSTEEKMIFKVEKRRFRQGGVLRQTRFYHLRYRLGEMPADRWQSLGVTDKQVAEKKAHEFIREKEREATGILEPKLLRTAATKPLSAHLEDYISDLEKRHRAGRNGRGARQLKMRVTTLLDECKWRVACDVNADSFIGWRSRQPKSARTLNHYQQAMGSFLNWLERSGRIKRNPLKVVGKIDERGQATRVRRAFNDDELRRLVSGSGARGVIYFTAARTGLRQEELRQLTWEDLRLDDEVPQVRVRAVCAKNKKEEHVPLVPEIAEALRRHRPADSGPEDLVFPNGVPRAARLRLDLEATGIAYQDESGRYADFHALRYTWATFLQRHGVQPRLAMKLLRHSHISLTTKITPTSRSCRFMRRSKAYRVLQTIHKYAHRCQAQRGKLCRKQSWRTKGGTVSYTWGMTRFVTFLRFLSRWGRNSG